MSSIGITANELIKPRKNTGVVAVWNRRVGHAMDALNDIDIRKYSIGDVADSDDEYETPAQIRTRTLLSKLDAVMQEVNKDSIPTSVPLVDGDCKIDLVTAQSYQFFKVDIPAALRHKAVKISLDAIAGDPDLFACTQEFPTSERNTWKSAGEGDDCIIVQPPHFSNTYYIGVFGYYQSEFKISLNFIEPAVEKRDSQALSQREAMMQNLQARIDDIRADDTLANAIARRRQDRMKAKILESRNGTITEIPVSAAKALEFWQVMSPRAESTKRFSNSRPSTASASRFSDASSLSDPIAGISSFASSTNFTLSTSANSHISSSVSSHVKSKSSHQHSKTSHPQQHHHHQQREYRPSLFAATTMDLLEHLDDVTFQFAQRVLVRSRRASKLLIRFWHAQIEEKQKYRLRAKRRLQLENRKRYESKSESHSEINQLNDTGIAMIHCRNGVAPVTPRNMSATPRKTHFKTPVSSSINLSPAVGSQSTAITPLKVPLLKISLNDSLSRSSNETTTSSVPPSKSSLKAASSNSKAQVESSTPRDAHTPFQQMWQLPSDASSLGSMAIETHYLNMLSCIFDHIVTSAISASSNPSSSASSRASSRASSPTPTHEFKDINTKSHQNIVPHPPVTKSLKLSSTPRHRNVLIQAADSTLISPDSLETSNRSSVYHPSLALSAAVLWPQKLQLSTTPIPTQKIARMRRRGTSSFLLKSTPAESKDAQVASARSSKKSEKEAEKSEEEKAAESAAAKEAMTLNEITAAFEIEDEEEDLSVFTSSSISRHETGHIFIPQPPLDDGQSVEVTAPPSNSHSTLPFQVDHESAAMSARTISALVDVALFLSAITTSSKNRSASRTNVFHRSSFSTRSSNHSPNPDTSSTSSPSHLISDPSHHQNQNLVPVPTRSYFLTPEPSSSLQSSSTSSNRNSILKSPNDTAVVSSTVNRLRFSFTPEPTSRPHSKLENHCQPLQSISPLPIDHGDGEYVSGLAPGWPRRLSSHSMMLTLQAVCRRQLGFPSMTSYITRLEAIERAEIIVKQLIAVVVDVCEMGDFATESVAHQPVEELVKSTITKSTKFQPQLDFARPRSQKQHLAQAFAASTDEVDHHRPLTSPRRFRLATDDTQLKALEQEDQHLPKESEFDLVRRWDAPKADDLEAELPQSENHPISSKKSSEEVVDAKERERLVRIQSKSRLLMLAKWRVVLALASRTQFLAQKLEQSRKQCASVSSQSPRVHNSWSKSAHLSDLPSKDGEKNEDEKQLKPQFPIPNVHVPEFVLWSKSLGTGIMPDWNHFLREASRGPAFNLAGEWRSGSMQNDMHLATPIRTSAAVLGRANANYQGVDVLASPRPNRDPLKEELILLSEAERKKSVAKLEAERAARAQKLDAIRQSRTGADSLPSAAIPKTPRTPNNLPAISPKNVPCSARGSIASSVIRNPPQSRVNSIRMKEPMSEDESDSASDSQSDEMSSISRRRSSVDAGAMLAKLRELSSLASPSTSSVQLPRTPRTPIFSTPSTLVTPKSGHSKTSVLQHDSSIEEISDRLQRIFHDGEEDARGRDQFDDLDENSSGYLQSLTSIRSLCGMDGSAASAAAMSNFTPRTIAGSTKIQKYTGSSLGSTIAAATTAAYATVLSDETIHHQRNQILFNSRLVQRSSAVGSNHFSGSVAARNQAVMPRKNKTNHH